MWEKTTYVAFIIFRHVCITSPSLSRYISVLRKDKLYAEVPKYKVITVAVISDRLKVNGSMARQALKVLKEEGLIKPVDVSTSCSIFTRATADTA